MRDWNDTNEARNEDALVEQATAVGLRALLELIRQQRLSGGQTTLRIATEEGEWEISARCVLRKGPWLMVWLCVIGCN